MIVWRHSGTILRTCKAVLRNHHTAEDATQAVFLTLARKARFIRNRESIFAWLHRTAYYISLKLAKKLARRSMTTTDLTQVIATGTSHETDECDFVIHQEIARLQEKYRLPILLCCFEGLSHTDAAKRLGWPVGTVDTRVARAKQLLQQSLTRRGLTIPAVGAAALLTTNPVGAVNAEFVETTVDAALTFASGKTAAGISPFALQLAQGALKTMFITRMQWVAAGFALCGALVFGGVTLAVSGVGNDSPESRDVSKSIKNQYVLNPITKPRIDEGEAKPIDPEIVKAFEKLGAIHGGFLPDERDVYRKRTLFREGKDAAAKGLPGFHLMRVARERYAELPGLPPVDVPFGLDFGGGATDEDLNFLIEQKNLVILNISNCHRLKSPETLGRLVKLRELNLSSCAGLQLDQIAKQLSDLKNLVTLDLGGVNLSDDALKSLSLLGNLESLDLGMCKFLSPEGLKSISKLSKLSFLVLAEDKSTLTVEGLADLKGLKNLKSLNLRSSLINDEGIHELIGIDKLERLNLGACKNVTDPGFRDLRSLKKSLVSLDLIGNKQLTDASIKDLASLERLKSLDLSGTDVTEVQDLRSLKNLETLNLDNTDTTNDSVIALAGMEKLKSLHLNHCRLVKDSAAAALSKTPCLERLDMQMCERLTDDGLVALSRSKSLVKLDLSMMKNVSNRGVEALTELKSLKELKLWSNNVSINDTCDIFRKTRPDCRITGP